MECRRFGGTAWLWSKGLGNSARSLKNKYLNPKSRIMYGLIVKIEVVTGQRDKLISLFLDGADKIAGLKSKVHLSGGSVKGSSATSFSIKFFSSSKLLENASITRPASAQRQSSEMYLPELRIATW